MTKTQWKKIAIGLSAAFGIACCLATSEVGQYGKNVMAVDYADTLTFELSAGESVSYTVSHSCDASKMPDGEPISILTTGTIVANLPDDAPEAGLITVLFKNQEGEENEQSLSITPGVPAELVSGKDTFKTWATGDTCAFTGSISIAHASGGTISGTMMASGTLNFMDAPDGVDVDGINYTVTAQETSQ